MIARTWHEAVPEGKSEAYWQFLQRTGVPDYKATPGNRGVFVLRRIDNGVAHFVLTSLWESVEAIRAFAGDDIERARYYPEDPSFLIEMEPTVTHHEVLMADLSPSSFSLRGACAARPSGPSAP
jgi:heme-degrading monooxygenase HmoA